MLLKDCQINKSYIIQYIKNMRDNYHLHLFPRGFIPGNTIQVLSKGNIMIVKVLNSKYGINSEIYNNVFVEE